MNRGLKLYGLPRRNVLDSDPTVANADFVLVVEVEIEAKARYFPVPQVFGGRVDQRVVLPELISLNFPSVIRTTTEPVCGQWMTWVGASLAARRQVTTIVNRAAGKIFVMVVLRSSKYAKSSSPRLVLRLRLRRGLLNDHRLLRDLTLDQHHLLHLIALQRLLSTIDADHHRSE
jgi:hypothetical protein